MYISYISQYCCYKSIFKNISDFQLMDELLYARVGQAGLGWAALWSTWLLAEDQVSLLGHKLEFKFVPHAFAFRVPS